MKVKTRDRILQASHQLFNQFGEPNVTTLQISDELDISPGNLYYHFKSKTDIVNELFADFEKQINELLEVPDIRISAEDQWLFLHLIFETIARFRFLYQDLVNVLTRYEHLQVRFKRILERKRKACLGICKSLKEQKLLNVDNQELDALCEQITLTATYWLSFEMITHLNDKNKVDLSRGVYQVMALVLPYLPKAAQSSVKEISRHYL